MSTLEMGDASTPPAPPANLPVFGFYIGGQTPHDWTDEQIAALVSRWALPIYVNITPSADPHAAAAEIISWLHAHDWARGTTVALDREDVPMPSFISELDQLISAAGYLLMDYQSKGAIPGEPLTAGGLWVPDWTGVPHMYPGALATQYANASMLGLPWDASLIDAAVPLHELHPPAVHPIPMVHVAVTVPELTRGDTGPAVTRLQHLLLAARPGSLPAFGPDGIFGAETNAAVRSFQRVWGITTDAGTVTAETWARLITG
jgi:Putative peptidoglycan binding domain